MDSKTAHSFSRNNKEAIERSETCACFHCLQKFNRLDIIEWIDAGQTALCPLCHVDAVLADADSVPFTQEFLSQLNKAWF